MVMTTETTQIDAAEVYSRIGRLEGEVSQMNERLGRVESKLDRLTFMLIGAGATFAIAQVAILVKVFLG